MTATTESQPHSHERWALTSGLLAIAGTVLAIAIVAVSAVVVALAAVMIFGSTLL